MSEQETYAAWFRELRMLENRLQERLQTLENRVQERLQSHESHGTQAIASVFATSSRLVIVFLSLLVAVLGGGIATIYNINRTYVDEKLSRAQENLTKHVETSLEDFKRNFANDTQSRIDRAKECLDRKFSEAQLRGCLEEPLRGTRR